jgi:hypothetical protein
MKFFFEGISFKAWQAKFLWALVTICSVSKYGCVKRLENRMDKWAFFVMDHIWLFVIIFAIIAVAATILKDLSEKTCPDCMNKSVPKHAKVCQKCGYWFSD